jgi:hypothetical protein
MCNWALRFRTRFRRFLFGRASLYAGAIVLAAGPDVFLLKRDWPTRANIVIRYETGDLLRVDFGGCWICACRVVGHHSAFIFTPMDVPHNRLHFVPSRDNRGNYDD